MTFFFCYAHTPKSVYFFQGFSLNTNEKRLFPSSYLSIYLHAWKDVIFVKFHIWDFCRSLLKHSDFGYKLIKIAETSYKHLPTFMISPRDLYL